MCTKRLKNNLSSLFKIFEKALEIENYLNIIKVLILRKTLVVDIAKKKKPQENFQDVET